MLFTSSTLWAVTGLRDYNFRLNGFLIDIALTRRALDYPCTVWRIWCWRRRWGRGPPRISVCFSAHPSSSDTSIVWWSCYCLSHNCWWWSRLYCHSASPTVSCHNISGADVDGSRLAIKGSHPTRTFSTWECVLIAEWPWLACPTFLLFRTLSSPFTDSLI